MTRLERPSVAINDPRAPGGFQMWRTYNLESADVSREHIIDRIASAAALTHERKIRNLVFSCHGESGYIELGQGFGEEHLSLFNTLRNKVDKIWIVACGVARGPVGYSFCSTLARNVHCYVVASTETQSEVSVPLPLDYISSFEGLVLSFEPVHGNISWSHRYPSAWHDRNGESQGNPD